MEERGIERRRERKGGRRGEGMGKGKEGREKEKERERIRIEQIYTGTCMAPSGHLILVLTTSSSIQPASAPNQPFMFTFQHKRMHLLKCQCYLEVLIHRDISL